MKEETRRNHYNAKSYLKGFRNSSKSIYRYNIKDDSILHANSLENIGIMRHLYSQEFEGWLEENFDAKYRTLIKIIYKCIETGKPISPEFLSLLISVVVYQKLRHPSERDFHFHKLEDLQKFGIQGPLEKIFSPQQSYEMVNNIVYKKIFSIIENKQGAILLAPKGCTFLTNDTGLGMVTTSITLEEKGLGFGTPNTYIFYPLDKKICLALSDGKRKLKDGIAVKPCEAGRYRMIQGAMLLGAKPYVYSSSLRNINIAKRESEIIKGITEEEIKRLRKV